MSASPAGTPGADSECRRVGSLLTSDDLAGLSDARVNELIEDLIAGVPRGDGASREFSDTTTGFDAGWEIGTVARHPE